MAVRLCFLLFQLLVSAVAVAQQGFAFTHLSTADGTGLASNKVGSLYQDSTGYIWVGTANGLQRFDGSKFIQLTSDLQKGDQMPHAEITQIVPADSGRLMLAMGNTGELGLFDPHTFVYRNIALTSKRAIPPKSDMRLWKSSEGNIYLVVYRFGILTYQPSTKTFVDNQPFPLPKNWHTYLTGICEDVESKQVWLGCDSGLCVYDKTSKEVWWRGYNPKKLSLLENKLLQENVTQVYVDSKGRKWVFGWPQWNIYKQYKLCFGKNGEMLRSDTVGLNVAADSYTVYDYFFETNENDLWIYGTHVLFNYDKHSRSFHLTKSNEGGQFISIAYDEIFQIIQDRDGSLWLATDMGIYYTPNSSGNLSINNLLVRRENETLSFNDVVEMPNGELWFGTQGNGIFSIDTQYNRVSNPVYNTPFPADWTSVQKADTRFVWSLCREENSSRLWIGCDYGVLMIYDFEKKKTQYLFPPECKVSTINYITQSKNGDIWLGTRNGRLIRYRNNKFEVIQDFETVIYKVFSDIEGQLWVSTTGKGVFKLEPESGRVKYHFAAGNSKTSLFSNASKDLDQLNDSIIVVGAGALNFINTKRNTVRWLRYEEGLPSNNVERLRVDRSGFLWIITVNGLSRYNPNNDRITTYGPKDGFVLTEQTTMADYETQDGNVVFTGSNAIIRFEPWVFAKTNRPPDVTITDFKIFNQYIPVDSLLQQPEIHLKPDQNSFSIYFASLSYMMRDKLTYYYKMDGIDKDWVKVDRSYLVNYSLLPPGRYNFKIYCENVEGVSSAKITELNIYVQPPFWRTIWFIGLVTIALAALIYFVQNLRIKRLLAVEQLRHRVARDLHDDMGSTLSTINILSSMAKAKLNSDHMRTGEYLSKIGENSQRMMEAMDDIIWSIKPSNDSIQKIAARMREFATSVLEAKDIDLQFNIREEIYDIKLNMEARRDFFLVFKEAVNNAAKYSDACKVIVDVSMDNNYIQLLVKDDGKGFDTQTENDGNGLGNMRKRTDHMKGKLSIESAPGKGTTVLVRVPILA